MSYNPNNPNGQATMANSAPVVIASDQSAIPVSGTVTASISSASIAGLYVDLREIKGVAVSVGNGATDTGTQRVTISNDSTGIISVAGRAAQGAAIAGNPVLLAGEDPSGNVATLQTAAGGDLLVDTELPAAAPLTDTTANPTTPMVGDALMAYDGTQWVRVRIGQGDGAGSGALFQSLGMVFNGSTNDRMRGDSTDGLLVNLGANNDVSVTNGAGASAVNIQDGGNSITVDGTVTSTIASTSISGLNVNLTKINGTATQSGSGTATGAIRVELPTNGTGVIATVGAVTAITNALPAGTNAIGKLAANSGVDIGDVDVTSIIPGTGATNLGKAEDAGHTTGDTGVASWGVRNDALSALTTTDLDYSPLATDSLGRTLVTESPFATQVLGTAAITGVASTQLLPASGNAGLRTYVTDIIVTNTSSTAVFIRFKNGSGGSNRAYTSAPANGGSNIVGLKTPIKTGLNTAFHAASSTAVSTIYITALGYYAP